MPVATGLGVVRRALRLRNAAGALLAVGLSLTLVTVAAPPSSATVVPVPVTGPSSLLGAVTEGGSAAGEALPVGIAMAGLGAYNGTCWALDSTGLASLLHLPSGGTCPQVGPGFLQFHFGASGDDRTSTGWWSVPCQAALCSSRVGGSPGTGTQFGSPLLNMDTPPSGYGYALRSGVTCADGSVHEAGSAGTDAWMVLTSHNWGSGYQYVNSMIPDDEAAGYCGGSGSYSTVAGKAVPSAVQAYWWDRGTCGGANAPYCQGGNSANTSPVDESTVTWTRALTLVHDTGLGTPWSMTWTQTCTDGTNTSTQTATATWTPTPNGAAPNPALPACPAGQHVSDVSAAGGRTGGPTELTIDKPTWTTTATTSYPLCTTHAPAGGCFLDLQKNGQSCFSGGVYCAGWTNNETRWVMKCEWGPYELATSICEAQYGTTFDFETPTEPSQGPTSGTGGFPNPSSGPSTGPTTGTTAQSLPTTGDNPASPPQPFDPTAPDPQPESQNCWGTGWSWNPVSWVYVPVKCALSAAFVPTQWPSWPSFPWAAPGLPHFTDDCPTLTLDLLHGTGSHPLAICAQIQAFLARPLWGSVTPPDLMGGLVTFFFAVRLLEKFEGAIGKGSEE